MMDVKKILVVEDNPVISKWIVHALKTMGYIPLGPAEDASSALEMVRNLSPDLVLMDIKLKGPENGIETSCAIKAITDIPLIYTTSSEDSETIEKATGTNPSAYLLKPLQHKQLKTSIEMALYSYEINKVLNREQSLINAFFDQSPAGIIITDSKLNIVKYNAAFANMADLDSFTQTPLYQLFDGIIAGDFLKNDNYRLECCLTGRPEYIIELVSRVINDKTTGRPLLCIINATDITSRKLYEQKMSEMNEVLEKRVSERTRELVNYISGLEDFSYSVSHDINVPLRSVEGLSSIIINEHASSLDPMVLDYLKRINNASRRISGLIDEMKSLSEITRAELNLEQINISQLCTKIIQHTIKNTGVKVEFKVSDKLFVRGDFVLIRLAFENLIHNAVKFSIPGKKNTISIGKEVRGDKTYIYIKDRGLGFNEAYLNKIFRPFEKLNPDDRYESYGIGLAKVQRIVSKHGGDVFAESIEGEGAVFYVNFG